MSRRLLNALLLSMILFVPGCAASDIFYNLFSGHYSGGGTLPIERREHYDRAVKQSQDFGKYGSSVPAETSPWNSH